jgi:hypothetical protein
MLRPMSSKGAKAFLARWADPNASERAASQPFLCGLCDRPGVARPEPTRERGYALEYDATEHQNLIPCNFRALRDSAGER